MISKMIDTPNKIEIQPLMPVGYMGYDPLRIGPGNLPLGQGYKIMSYSISGSTIAIPTPVYSVNFEFANVTMSTVPALFPSFLEEPNIQQEYPNQLEQKIKALFEAGKDEFFEDGMESSFSRELIFRIKKYEMTTIAIISRLIRFQKVSPEVASEALRWIGWIDHTVTYAVRRELLIQSLFSPSPVIRDGALLGLSYLDDPNTIDSIRQALGREPIPELQESMKQVIAQLEETGRCLSS